MYKPYTYRIFALLLMLATAFGCRTADPVPGTDAETEAVREPASLVLTTDFRALITPEGTRANDADDNTIRHAALFLIDYMDNRLVAYRIIDPGTTTPYNDIDEQNGFVDETTGLVDPSLTSGKSVRVTFNYNDPKHGAAEKLTRGSYMLLAVANFSESDQFGDSGIATQIRNLVDRFRESPDTGITEFRETCESFYNLKLKIPEKTVFPYIRPGDVSIPLSSTHILNLISGQNHATAELKHTSARVRVELRNYSDLPLTINNLAFSSNFTQSTSYLFSRTDGENYAIENDHYGKGAPVVTDDNAITAFTPGRILTKEDGTTTLFDGLIYESRDLTNNYTYAIDVSYEGEGDLHNYTLKGNGQTVTTPDGVAAQGPYFLIRRSSAFSYLYVQNDKVYASTGSYTPQEILDLCKRQNYYYNYVWELVPYGSSYRLRNVQTGDYIENVQYNSQEYEYYRLGTTEESGADSFTLETNNGFLLFRSDYYRNHSWYGNDAYINTRGTDNTLVVGWNGTGEWSQFALYPLDAHRSLNARHEVVLRTIDKASGVVSDVHEIERNDYIRILVEVSYNPDKGDFDFNVNDWETGGDEITFN